MNVAAFLRKIDKNGPRGCWTWTGYKQSNGYGKFDRVYVHRISYELHKGPIPEGLQIDHLCRNRGCVNPEHLEAVTRQENIRRGEMHLIGPRLAAKRTHCKRGHRYDEPNTYWCRGRRQCRQCKRDFQHWKEGKIVNRAIIIGNLGKDPEVRYTGSGKAVGNFSVATNEKWTDKEGQKQEKVEWHRIVVWDKQAELCAEYLSKGRQVAIEGRIQTREWIDKDGTKKYTTEIVADRVEFLSGRNGEPKNGNASSEEEASFP